jgi:hypothetical protein
VRTEPSIRYTRYLLAKRAFSAHRWGCLYLRCGGAGVSCDLPQAAADSFMAK